MSGRIVISRDDLELGALSKAEAQELLQAGFLKPTDSWRPENSNERRLLLELVPSPPSPGLAKSISGKLAVAGKSLVGGASQITTTLKSVVGRSQQQMRLTGRQLLEGFVPQLQKLAASQLVKQPVESIRDAMGQDQFMRNFFGAIYDCLPKPVCRFVTEDAFLAFCMERRGLLLKVERPDNNTGKTIAIIGASNDRAKFGNKAVRAFVQQGYQVFPVNPKEETIEGLRSFKSVAEVPVRPHRISVYLPPPVLLKVLPDIATKGCDELWLNPGTESDEVLAQAEQLGLNVVQACSIVGVGMQPSEL